MIIKLLAAAASPSWAKKMLIMGLVATAVGRRGEDATTTASSSSRRPAAVSCTSINKGQTVDGEPWETITPCDPKNENNKATSIKVESINHISFDTTDVDRAVKL